MKTLRLYIHIPYCRRRCPYCDFPTYADPNPDWDALFAALQNELSLQVARWALQGRKVRSIFFGGGTPSLAPPEKIGALLEHIAALLRLDARAEITLEANPESASLLRLREMRAAGVNRLSLGVQSLTDKGLSVLGRLHDAAQARRAYEAARRAGFAQINLDFIYGWPGQTLANWARELREAVRMAPDHLSCYELTIEPATPFAKRGIRAADEELALAMWQHADAFLCAHGYEHYEISNYARAGARARHNEGYWRYEDYLGIGPGAASKLDGESGAVWRWRNERHLARYLQALRNATLAVAETERLAPDEAAREALWLALRRREGARGAPFVRRFGLAPATLARRHLPQAVACGLLLTDAQGGVRASKQGMLLLDTLAAKLFG